MVPPPARQGARPSELGSSPPSLKRKRANRHSSPNPIPKQQRQQPTIHSLLSSQRKSQSNLSAVGSPDSTFSAANLHSSPPPSTPSRRLAKGDMYKFESRSPTANGNTVIDLTQATPPASPQVRKLNGSLRIRSGLNPNTGAKKLVVKNLKTSVPWDAKAYLEKIWTQLDQALTVIFNDGSITFSKEDLYRGVENVCRQGGASTLFSRLNTKCRRHMEEDVRAPLIAKATTDKRATLKAVLGEWLRWKEHMVTIRAVYFFLDRSYLLSSTSKPTLAEFTPQLFREIVYQHQTLKDKIVDGACDLVAADRNSTGDADQTMFRQAIDMFHELAVYTASFEPRYLGTTQQYITAWSDEMIEDNSVSEYVAIARKCIDEEMSRCEEFALDASTRRDLLTLLEEHLIVTKQNDLADYEALSTMLDRNATDELSALYALLDRRRLGDALRPAFEKWVDDTGTSIVFAKQEDLMIVHLLSLKRRLDHIWRSSFSRNETIGHALRETFETFMNKTKKGDATWGTDNTKVGEMIAKYVDQLLRGGVKAIPEVLTARRSSSITAPLPVGPEIVPAAAQDDDNEDEEVDEDAEINIQLDQVLDLFRFVHGKAVFEAFYKRDLARRLLMARSASADAERSMLTRLKTECGSGFTQNLEQMFKDVEMARDEMLSFKQRLEDRIGFEKGKAIDLNVNILSAAAWPSYPDIPVVIPANVKRAIDDFEMHYKSKHSGRKLDWKHALAHCQMRATFGKTTKELVVSSFQAVVLLLFNGLKDDGHLTYQHILTETGLPEPDVKRTLQSLACAKLRPLTKHPKGKDINATDTFSINLDFSHPKYRVKINQVQLKETKEENKETHMRVAEDRNFECQAAIVRILKSRKTISHTELISETIKATMSRGVLAMSDIKKNIDRLIEKDYMEREDGNMYSYVA